MGLVIAGIGLLFVFMPKVPWLGKLPGDILIEKNNFRFYFPIGTCIIISIILTLLFYLFKKWPHPQSWNRTRQKRITKTRRYENTKQDTRIKLPGMLPCFLTRTAITYPWNHLSYWHFFVFSIFAAFALRTVRAFVIILLFFGCCVICRITAQLESFQKVKNTFFATKGLTTFFPAIIG